MYRSDHPPSTTLPRFRRARVLTRLPAILAGVALLAGAVFTTDAHGQHEPTSQAATIGGQVDVELIRARNNQSRPALSSVADAANQLRDAAVQAVEVAAELGSQVELRLEARREAQLLAEREARDLEARTAREAAERAEIEAAAQAQAAKAAAEQAAKQTRSSRGMPSEARWEALRRCESSGNYSIVSRTGRYRGAYQFSVETWNWVAQRHHPHLVGVDPARAAPGDQDAMARSLYAMNGSAPWPECGRHLRN
jgi:hypothetical protein